MNPAPGASAPRGGGPWGRLRLRLADPAFRWTAGVALFLLAGLGSFFLQRIHAVEEGGPTGTGLALFLLVNINVVLLTVLVFLFARNLIKLVSEGRRKVFGYRLRAKLVAIFVGFTLVPTLMFFFVAQGIVNDSVNAWFGPDIRRAMEGSVALTADLYAELGQGSTRAALTAAESLPGGLPPAQLTARAEELRRSFGLAALELFDREGRLLARAWDGVSPVPATAHDAELIRDARAGKPGQRAVPTGDGDLLRGAARSREGGVVVATRFLPQAFGRRAEELSQAYRTYTEMRLLRGSFRTNYIVYLMLLSFLIFFSATWLGFYLARVITVPLNRLAETAERVAEGDLGVRVPEEGAGDEVGILVRSFNRMTGHLEEGRRALTEAQHVSEERRLYMEAVLRSVGTAVVTLDGEAKVRTFNPAAEKLFGIRAESVLGRPYREVLSPEHARVVDAFLREASRRRGRTVSREVPALLRGSPLILHLAAGALEDPSGNASGFVLALEDMTQLVHAQREAAWSEVARRVAHEVKNPLTPIRLSAERLARRLAGTLGEEQERLVAECTSAIVREVEGMRALVDEFSRFARLPVLKLAPGSLNRTVEEAAALYREDRSLPGGVRLQLGTEVPEMRFDAEQVKRVLVNLLDNARHAVQEVPGGEVSVRTRFSAADGVVEVTVTDNGAGLPAGAEERLFTPYFSTRPGGTGLGLSIARRIAEEHGGRIAYERNHPRGSRFTLTIPVDLEPRGEGTDSATGRRGDGAEEKE